MNTVGFYPLVKYLEVVLGGMLLFNILVPVALAVMAGIAMQIVYLNLFVSPHPRELWTGTQELLLCGLLLIGYSRIFKGLFQWKARPGFFWQPGAAQDMALPAVAPLQYVAQRKDFWILLAVTVVWTGVVLVFSTSMFARPLRMYDWSSPVLACALAMLGMWMERRQVDAPAQVQGHAA